MPEFSSSLAESRLIAYAQADDDAGPDATDALPDAGTHGPDAGTHGPDARADSGTDACTDAKSRVLIARRGTC